MPSRKLDRAVDLLARTIEPRTVLHQREATARAIDETGQPVKRQFVGIMPPTIKDFRVGTAGRKRAGHPGTLTLITAYAETAPTTGDALLMVSQYNPLSGDYLEHQLTIPAGSNVSDDAMPNVPVAASDLFDTWVSVANGASAIDLSLTITVGV
jgi:hypothetical protein